MENLWIYEKGRAVPQEAIKTIGAGRLKGMSDINPLWRIRILTEMFGPCGIGWWYEIKEKRIVDDPRTNQSAAFVDILLYYKDPETGTESHGIPGTGGASFVAQESKGAYLSDECFKMALTDAISVACKALGIGADVYFAAGRTKYSDEEPPRRDKAAQKPPAVDVPRCQACHGPILSKDPNITPQELAETRRLMTQGQKFRNGLRLCDACYANWQQKYGTPVQDNKEVAE